MVYVQVHVCDCIYYLCFYAMGGDIAYFRFIRVDRHIEPNVEDEDFPGIDDGGMVGGVTWYQVTVHCTYGDNNSNHLHKQTIQHSYKVQAQNCEEAQNYVYKQV